MSLGGGYSDAVNSATNAAVQAVSGVYKQNILWRSTPILLNFLALQGAHMTLSAGNDNGDSCIKSPASSELG